MWNHNLAVLECGTAKLVLIEAPALYGLASKLFTGAWLVTESPINFQFRSHKLKNNESKGSSPIGVNRMEATSLSVSLINGFYGAMLHQQGALGTNSKCFCLPHKEHNPTCRRKSSYRSPIQGYRQNALFSE